MKLNTRIQDRLNKLKRILSDHIHLDMFRQSNVVYLNMDRESWSIKSGPKPIFNSQTINFDIVKPKETDLQKHIDDHEDFWVTKIFGLRNSKDEFLVHHLS